MRLCRSRIVSVFLVISVTFLCSWIITTKKDFPNDVHYIKKSLGLQQIEQYLKAPAASSNSPLKVLILSSMPRSGSTLLSQMLSNIDSSILYYEPLWLVRKEECIKDDECIEKYMKDIFTCNHEERFEKWLKSKHIFLYFFNPQAKYCVGIQNKTEQIGCIKDINMKEECHDSQVRLMKVIRGRLRWMKKWLNTSTNLKIIHLTRDPRGSITSINKFGKSWEHNPSVLCKGLQEDLLTYDHLKNLYPSKVMHVSYEQLCLSPLDETSRVFEFLYGSPTIPDGVNKFIDEHMTQTKGQGSLNTYKKSNTEFEAWRWKIKENLLQKIEAEPTCLQAITKMGHNVFITKNRVSNESIPLFT